MRKAKGFYRYNHRLLILALVFCAILLFALPASAETFYFEDSANHDEYIVYNSQDTYEKMKGSGGDAGIVGGTWHVVLSTPYDSYSIQRDDKINHISCTLEGYGENFTMPFALAYFDNTERAGYLDVEYTGEQSFILFTAYDIRVTLRDDAGTITQFESEVWGNGHKISLDITPESMKIGRSLGALANTTEVSLLPCKAFRCDLNSVPIVSHLQFEIIDTETYQHELDGFLGWIYNRIDIIDSDGGLKYSFMFIDYVWNIGIGLVRFFFSSFWYCVLGSQVYALGYAVMAPSGNLDEAIQRYFTALFNVARLPYIVFKVFLDVLRALGNLIPFT